MAPTTDSPRGVKVSALRVLWLAAALGLMAAASAQNLTGFPYLGGAFQVVEQGVHAQAGMIGVIVPGVGIRADVTVTFRGNYMVGGSALYHGTVLPGSPIEGYFGGGVRLGSELVQGNRRTVAGAGVLAGGAFSIGPAGVFAEAGGDWLSAAGLRPSLRIGVRYYP